MNRRKGRKKPNSSKLELIGPALLPAVALTAVPSSPPPQLPPGNPLGLASAVFDASFLLPGSRSGDAGRPSPRGADGGATDPESSLYDYNEMEDAGYAPVGYGTWPNQNRKSYSDRERAPTPPNARNVATVAVVSQSGELYHILEPDENGGPSEMDIYAVPMKAKGKGPGKKKGSGETLEDVGSMDQTQRDVRKAMQAVHDMPVEETMTRLSENRNLASAPGSTSGRGTMMGDVEDHDEEESEEAPPLPPPLTANNNAIDSEPAESDRTEVKAEVETEVVDGVKDEAYVVLKQEEVKDKLHVVLKQGADGPLSAGSGTATGSGRLSSRRSATPRDAASFALQMEVEQMKEENQQLQQEVLSLKRVAKAAAGGDKEGAENLIQNRQVDDLKEENEVLKNTVGRLNQELSRYQATFRPLSQQDRSRLQALPTQGPVPSWLINKRYLAPLFLAYDDLIQDKEQYIHKCHEELQALKERTAEVVRENQRYQLQGDDGARKSGPISQSDWRQLQEQAKLVLEENQVLVEQLELQQAKVKDLCASHMHEVSRLSKKLTTNESEKEEMERELEEIKRKFRDIRHKYDKMLLESGNHLTLHDHISTVSDLKRSVTEEKELFEKEAERLSNKLKASDDERKRQTLAAIEVAAENKQLRAEIKALHKTLRRCQNKVLLLQQAVQQSESKELVTQNEMANLIRVVEKTALERDTAYKVVKEQQRESKDTVSCMVGNSVIMGKMEEKLKMYKLKASAKLQTVAERLKEQDDAFNRQRQEYEREIRYLRALVKEKEELIADIESQKKNVEQDLEVMWQAASSENQRLKDTLVSSVHKLKEHPSLKVALDQEEELDKLLQFSE